MTREGAWPVAFVIAPEHSCPEPCRKLASKHFEPSAPATLSNAGNRRPGMTRRVSLTQFSASPARFSHALVKDNLVKSAGGGHLWMASVHTCRASR